MNRDLCGEETVQALQTSCDGFVRGLLGRLFIDFCGGSRSGCEIQYSLAFRNGCPGYFLQFLRPELGAFLFLGDRELPVPLQEKPGFLRRLVIALLQLRKRADRLIQILIRNAELCGCQGHFTRGSQLTAQPRVAVLLIHELLQFIRAVIAQPQVFLAEYLFGASPEFNGKFVCFFVFADGRRRLLQGQVADINPVDDGAGKEMVIVLRRIDNICSACTCGQNYADRQDPSQQKFFSLL